MLLVASNQPGVIDQEAGGKFMNSCPDAFQSLLGFEILNYLCPFHANRAFRDWGTLLNNDNTLASAMIDRLVHHGVLVQIKGESYRIK